MTSDEPGRWRIINSEYLYREPWLTVRKEMLEMPNGNVVSDYYVLEYPQWVNTIAITKENKFLFVQQYRHGIEKTCFELCAGVMDKEDSSAMETAQRELMEETGFGGGEWEEFIFLAPNASAMNNYAHTFIARGVEELVAPSPEDSEDILVHLLSYNEMKSLLESGKIIQATMAAPLWKFVSLYDNKYNK